MNLFVKKIYFLKKYGVKMKMNWGLLRNCGFTLLIGAFAVSCAKEEIQKKQGFDVAGMDTTVTPQDNFYQYAVGNWLKKNPVPDDQMMWAAFTELAEKTDKDVKKIIEDAAKSKTGAIEGKVGDFYNIAMDSAKADKLGYTPIKGELERIDAIKDLNGVFAETAHMYQHTSQPFFSIFVDQDQKNSEMMIAQIYQGGYGLADRDYYVGDDSRSKEIRTKYVEHISKMFKLISYSETEAKKAAETVMKIETRLAKAGNTRTENRDPEATYNKMTIAELKKITAKFDWDTFFTGINLTNPGDVNVCQPKFIKEVGKIVSDTNIEELKTYLKWNIINGIAGTLSKEFVNEQFEFNSKFMNGQPKDEPRWKKAVNSTNYALGEAVGQLYVKVHFPAEAKERAKKIVNNLLVAMGERIKQLDWMSEETKAKALKKLDGFGVKIGYPDKWKDYSSLEIKNDSYAANVMRANVFVLKDMLRKVNKPVDKTEWWMTPQTVNAGYSPSMNDITFPAGILQFPFFDKDVDDAINYGAMGAVIGHEITHGFDDQGAKYDVNGNLNNWWTKEDLEKFNSKSKGLVEQFNQFSPFPGFNVNGEMTLGENISDLGGLTVSYQAFKKTEQFKKNEKIDGFTPAQRFYLSWAQVWKNNIREDGLKTLLKIDVHSPGMYRVLGPLANIPEFFEAFKIQEGDKMRRPADKIVKIW